MAHSYVARRIVELEGDAECIAVLRTCFCDDLLTTIRFSNEFERDEIEGATIGSSLGQDHARPLLSDFFNVEGDGRDISATRDGDGRTKALEDERSSQVSLHHHHHSCIGRNDNNRGYNIRWGSNGSVWEALEGRRRKAKCRAVCIVVDDGTTVSIVVNKEGGRR